MRDLNNAFVASKIIKISFYIETIGFLIKSKQLDAIIFSIIARTQ